MLRETFINLIHFYTKDSRRVSDLWLEIETNYSGKKRHYHTFAHLENLLNQLLEVKEQITDWDTILFTLYYHDIIYNPLNSNNEEDSAELAETRMKFIAIPDPIIDNCKQQILATKQHVTSVDDDTNYFLDADLSILGQNWDDYEQYAKNVRKEYSIYPDIIYKPGRKKVLNHFLAMERIFKTDYFFEKFESQAKENLKMEIKSL